MAEYRRSDLLVETEWLADHLNDPNVRVIEMAQDGSEFEAGHIPGAAISPTWQIKGSANTRLVAPAAEAKDWFESVGITDNTLEIGYDRFHCRDAARLWWVLNYYGHGNVRVLNGGWKKLTAEGRTVETGTTQNRAKQGFTPKDPDHRIASTVETLIAAVGRDDTVIWDVRTEDEFNGNNSRGNARVGHVPGAVHLEWLALVNLDDDTFKSQSDIEDITRSIGISAEKMVHAY